MKHETPKATLPITVPSELHDAMAEACGEPFAISYLCGAIVVDGFVRPRTAIAYDRLRAEPKAMHVLGRHALHIGRPLAPHEREDLFA